MSPLNVIWKRGRRYRIRVQGHKETWEVNYLGRVYAGGVNGDDLQFDARPVAGTQTVSAERIVEAEDIGPAIWDRS